MATYQGGTRAGGKKILADKLADKLAMINGIAMKGKHIIKPYLLQRQILEQLHNNHLGIEKTHLLTRESV